MAPNPNWREREREMKQGSSSDQKRLGWIIGLDFCSEKDNLKVCCSGMRRQVGLVKL